MARTDDAPKSIQQVATELWELSTAYAKQETLDPLKGLGRYLSYGIGGALLLGGGIIMLPRYVADQRPALREILPETFSVSLQLWLLIHKEVARLARIQSVAAMVRSCFP